MVDSGIRSDKINASKVSEKAMSANSKLKQQYSLGDIAWIKNRDNSWWPVQVVDENIVGGKAKKNKKDEILVRLYGSCDYLYVDPTSFSSEFENYLKQENISSKEAIQKSLEKDLHRMPGENSKRKVSETKDISTVSSEGKLQKQEMLGKQADTHSSGSSPTNQDEERRKQQEKVASAGGAEEDEATKSMACTEPLDEPNANSVKVNTAETKKNKSGVEDSDQSDLRRSLQTPVKELSLESDKLESSKNNNGEQSELELQNQGINTTEKKKFVKSGVKVTDRSNLRRSLRIPATELSRENDKTKSSKNNNGELELQNHGEKMDSSKQFNAGETKQEVKKLTQRKITAEQMQRTHEEISKLVVLELAKHRQEQASMTGVQLEADKDDPKGKNMNASPNQKTGSPELTKNHTPEDTPCSRKIKVMLKLGLMAPSGSPFSRKRKL